MISLALDSKTKSVSESSPLSLSPKDEKPSSQFSLFSQLLNGINEKEDGKLVQNGALILSLETQDRALKPDKNISKDILSSLLNSNSKDEKDTFQTLELNPQLTKTLSPSQLKELVNDAKKYLKTKIIKSEGFKKFEIEALPKTLKGLIAVAKKFNLDVSKISYEEIRNSSNNPKSLKSQTATIENQVKEEVKLDNKKTVSVKPIKLQTAESAHQAKEEVKLEKFETTSVKPVKLQKQENLHQEKEEVKLEKLETTSVKPVKLQQSESLHQVKQEVKTEKLERVGVVHQVKEEVKLEKLETTSVKPVKLQQSESLHQVKQEAKTEKLERVGIVHQVKEEEVKLEKLETTSVKPVKLQQSESLYQVKQEIKRSKQSDTQEQIKQVEAIRLKDSVPITKDTLLFKAQTQKEVTTEQLVQVRRNALPVQEANQSKIKADETLKLLLRGEKVLKKEENGLTTDFSVATARVIAPTAITNASKNLESLLHGDNSETTQGLKTDGLNVPKADTLDIKLHEAKQMTKYISQDVKTAIEDYKSPFTRVKVQLNPERLGAVELTVVQRGKNLHINLSSNNAAINALAMNANDLKLQLTNNGINNASLNFNNNSQSSEGSFSGQGQNPGQQKEASREYNFFESEENNEEILNSLEIVVPDYA